MPEKFVLKAQLLPWDRSPGPVQIRVVTGRVFPSYSLTLSFSSARHLHIQQRIHYGRFNAETSFSTLTAFFTAFNPPVSDSTIRVTVSGQPPVFGH